MFPSTMLPAISRPWSDSNGQPLPVQANPGISDCAIDSLQPAFPGVLTEELKTLLIQSCGLDGTALQYIDFTGRWHDGNALEVFQPCITLAIDAAGRRWIAECDKTKGLPGPIWCVEAEPEVAVYVSADLSEFLMTLRQHTCAGSIAEWFSAIDASARRIWANRGALAFHSRQECGHDPGVRAWLLQLPRDARVYDVRSPKFGAGWPYGAAGSGGRVHRCGREFLFAVSGFPAPTRWRDHLETLAKHYQPPRPAVLTNAFFSDFHSLPKAAAAEMKSCA